MVDKDRINEIHSPGERMDAYFHKKLLVYSNRFWKTCHAHIWWYDVQNDKFSEGICTTDPRQRRCYRFCLDGIQSVTDVKT